MRFPSHGNSPHQSSGSALASVPPLQELSPQFWGIQASQFVSLAGLWCALSPHVLVLWCQPLLPLGVTGTVPLSPALPPR